MPTRAKARRRGSRRRQHSSQSTFRELVPTARQTPVAAILQRAKLNPGSLTPSDVLRLQRTVGNQRAVQLLAGPDGQAAVQRKMTVTTELPKKLGDEAQGKLDNIVKDLQKVGEKVKPAVELKVEIIDKIAVCPAETVAKNGKITVRLRKYFLEMASEGEILGLLAHELGVHTLADIEMKEKDPKYAGKELFASIHHKGTLKKLIESELAITPPEGRLRKGPKGTVFEPTGSRQMDHIMVAQGIVYKTSQRAERYVKTMLRMGDAIDNSTRKPKDKTAAQLDLLKTFFLDVGRLVAADADDAPVRTFKAAPLIAEVMNWYRAEVKGKYESKHPWLGNKELDFTATGKFVRKWLAGMLFKWSKKLLRL